MSKLGPRGITTLDPPEGSGLLPIDMLGIKESFYVLPVAPATGEDSSTFVNSTMPPAKF